MRRAGISQTGLVQPGNADAAYAGAQVLAVASGQGGTAAGRLASSTAIDAVSALDDKIVTLSRLDHAIRQIDRRLHDVTAGHASLAGMGTTLSAVVWTKTHVALAQVGHCRVYLLRDQDLLRLTSDRRGMRLPVRNGTAETVSARYASVCALSLRQVKVRDRLLLCTPGLVGVVPEKQMHRLLSYAATPGNVVNDLVALAYRAGAPGNVTCVVAEIGEVHADEYEEDAPPLRLGARAAG